MFFRKSVLVFLAVAMFLFLLPGSGFGQVETKVFPLAFYGGTTDQPGDFRFGPDLVLTSTVGAARSATITFTGQNGQPLPVGLNGGSKAATQTVSVPAFGKVRLAFNPQNAIDVLWVRVEHESGLLVFFEYRMFVAGSGREEFFSHAEFVGQTSAARLFDAPVQLGSVSGFPQREFVPAVVNPSATSPVTTTLTVFDGQVEKGRVVRTIPPMGQIYLLLSQADFPGLVLDGRLEISSTGDVFAGGVKFLNGRFNLVPVTERNLAPNIGLESPQNNAVIESANLAIPFGGWAFDWTPGTVVSMLARLLRPADGTILASTPVARNIARSDVAAAFPGNPDAQTSGFAGQIQSSESGVVNLVVEAMDNGGAVSSATRTVTIRRPPVVPAAGEYRGEFDLLTSLPLGKVRGGGFGGTVVQGGDSWLIVDPGNTGPGLNLTLECTNGVAGSSWLVSNTPLAITDGQFRKVFMSDTIQGCSFETVGTFLSPNEFQVVHKEKGACLDNRFFLRNVKPCPDIELRALVRKQ